MGIVSVPTTASLRFRRRRGNASPHGDGEQGGDDLKLNIIVAVWRYEIDVSEFNWKGVIYDIPTEKGAYEGNGE